MTINTQSAESFIATCKHPSAERTQTGFGNGFPFSVTRRVAGTISSLWFGHFGFMSLVLIAFLPSFSYTRVVHSLN